MRRYRKAAAELSFLSFLGILNFILYLFGKSVYLFLAPQIPAAVFLYGKSVAGQTGEKGYLTAALFIAFCLLAAYVFSRIRAGRSVLPLLIAALMYTLDTAAVAVMAHYAFGTVGYLDIALRAVVLLTLFRGVFAGRYLSSLPYDPEEMERIFSDPGNGEERKENGCGDTEPLRDYVPRRRFFFNGQYGDLSIKVCRSFGLTELVVNGKVYDEYRGIAECEYTLYAELGGRRISAELVFDGREADMLLVIDGREVDRIRRR